jgi:hypothetical protein
MADNDSILLDEMDGQTIFDQLPGIADNIHLFSPINGAIRG